MSVYLWPWFCSMQYAYATLSSVAVWLYNISPLYFTKARFLKKKKMSLNMKCVFWSLVQICLKIFLFQEYLSDVWSKIYVGLHVKYPIFLSDIKEIWIFSIDIGKILNHKISWKSFRWELSRSMRMDGRTDGQMERTMLISAFRDFVNEPKSNNIY